MREQINEELKELFGERFAELWWDLRLPGLGKNSPTQVFGKDPQSLLDYVLAYREDEANE